MPTQTLLGTLPSRLFKAPSLKNNPFSDLLQISPPAMEEPVEDMTNLKRIDADGEEEARKAKFSELKTYCLDLFDLLQNPRKKSPSLSHLQGFLSRSPASTLQPFFDYTLFPLLLLLDASVNCRSHSSVKNDAKLDLPQGPLKISDFVAEGMLQCLEELLKKCHLGSVDQMVVVLKKLTYGLMLSPSEASEEFRLGMIRCFRALLLSLHLCSSKSCSCKQISGLPALTTRRDLHFPMSERPTYISEAEECLLSFFHSQTASTAIGHWLSLLLKTADIEAVRGHRGSATIRIEAFLTLRILVAKVGTADALAFFLPGVVSQFAKVLHASKVMVSGAGGSAEALDQSVRGLAEFLMIVLGDDANKTCLDRAVDTNPIFGSNEDQSAVSFLEELRNLPGKAEAQTEVVEKVPSNDTNLVISISDSPHKEHLSPGNTVGSLNVSRTGEWFRNTTTRVNKLLSATFPHLCIDPAKRARQGALDAIQGLLSKCCCTLKESRLILLECVCVLACDDSEEVSSAAQAFLQYQFSSSTKNHVQHDFADIFSRLIERVPKVVLGSDQVLALSEVQKLLVVIYFSGPQVVADHILQSPVTTARFLDVFALCLSQNSGFAGSLDKLILTRPSSKGYLQSISEMRASILFVNDNGAASDASLSGNSSFSTQNKEVTQPVNTVQKEYKLPRIPPWFVYVGSDKLYEALAGILRLVGLSLIAESRNEGALSTITDIPLSYLRKLVSELRVKEYSNESWQSWYNRTGSGQLVRQASTAVCILNEILFGASEKAFEDLTRMFQKSSSTWVDMKACGTGSVDYQSCDSEHMVPTFSIWKNSRENAARNRLIDCIGVILHEYLSLEVWSLPLDHKNSFQQLDGEASDISLHFFHDAAMLYQVVIEGIGIFSMCLGEDFASSGFLHSSIFVLLENLICSNFQIRSAADAVLHIISATGGYPTVGHLVLANSDYIVDSICRQLRHLDLNPQVPNVLASILSYIGVAQRILPLLEEPMRSISMELEILGRHQHPNLTIPFLKAVAEIAKASKREASSLPQQATLFFEHVSSKASDMEKKITKNSIGSEPSCSDETGISPMESEDDPSTSFTEEWENILFKLNDSRRYRRTVGSVAGSCLAAASPLLASLRQEACLVALGIVEDGIVALAKVEEAYKNEKKSKEAVNQILELCSFYSLKDALDTTEDVADENRLLPAMNKLWPFLVVCMRNKNPVAVRRCSGVISKVVQVCGGDFFSRRFHTDGAHFWKLLSTSPFHSKPFSKEDRAPLQLPYRNNSISSEASVAETSTLKVQSAVLNMIADLSREKRSAPALDAVLKKVSGLVVGIACSGVVGLREASVNALVGLASVDPDLVWLLLADVYYSKSRNTPLPPSSDLPEVSELLPPPVTSKDHLYVQYGGQSYGFDIDFASVEFVFKKLHSLVFTHQMYI